MNQDTYMQMKKRYQKLLNALRPISSIEEQTGMVGRTFEKKAADDDQTSIKPADILMLERCAQIRDGRLIKLIAEALAETEFVASSDEVLTKKEIRDHVRQNYEQFMGRAEKIVNKSVYK